MKLLISDKAFHFLYCFLIAIVGWWFGAFIGIGYGWILALLFAVGKEIYDWFSYGKKIKIKAFIRLAGADLIADGIGIALACLIIIK